MSNKMMFGDMDALMNASMDDLEDLPPVGVPPTGHYNFEVSAEMKANNAGTGQYIQMTYQVTAVNEVKNPEEADQAAVGMKFSDRFSPFKKDGSINEYGVGFLKQALAPYAAHFATQGIGDTLQVINKVAIMGELTRRVDKQDAERFNFSLKNVEVL